MSCSFTDRVLAQLDFLTRGFMMRGSLESAAMSEWALAEPTRMRSASCPGISLRSDEITHSSHGTELTVFFSREQAVSRGVKVEVASGRLPNFGYAPCPSRCRVPSRARCCRSSSVEEFEVTKAYKNVIYLLPNELDDKVPKLYLLALQLNVVTRRSFVRRWPGGAI